MARHPAFAPEEIERQRQQMLSGLKVSYDDPEYLADVVFDRLVYGFHPYGMPRPARRSRLRGDHARRPGGVPQALVRRQQRDPRDRRRRDGRGGVRRRRARVRRLGDGAEQPRRDAVEPPPPTRRVVVIDKPDAVQTEIRVGNIGDPAQAPRLPGARPRDQDPRRRRRQPAAPGAAVRARPDLRRVGRHRTR